MSRTTADRFSFSSQRQALLDQLLAEEGAGPGERTSIPRRSDAGSAPLSFAQQRLWFLHQMESDPASYNLPLGLRLEGELAPAALRRSVEEVVARHEVLRTRFVEEGGEPVQRIDPPGPFALPVVDLGSLPAQAREERLRRALAAEARTPFDLERAPLLRGVVVRLSEREHALLMTMHHIVSDGWSVAVLTRELKAHYEARTGGAAAGLPPLPVQYGDFAAWQRERLQGGGLEARLEYWVRQLAGAPAEVELPADHPRPAVQRFRGTTLPVHIPAPRVDSLRGLARGEGATLFMALLAGFSAFLHCYTGQDDLVVGTPSSGREHPEVEPLIGCFINVLPLRTRPRPGVGFRGLLRDVRDVTLAAFQHQEVSFGHIVDALALPRDTSRNPLVQVLFALQNTPAARFRLLGVEARVLEVDSGTSRYDLSLYLREAADGSVAGHAELNTDLFEPSTVERWLEHFGRLLAALAADPERPVGAAELLSGEERERILREWNRTELPFDPRDGAVHRFEAQVRRTPGAEALVCGDERLSYAELNRRANRWAHELAALGAGPEVRVGILLERSVDMVV
ncbi:MAG TPA: condensation domain-containing protein, partial [Longimicrobiaceae bacterium]|nr:condensation domain-containing protein [Longimicrobiaceae bacterium]